MEYRKKMVIVAPFYQQTVRHVAKQGVSTLIDNFVPVTARDVAHKVEDFSGEKKSEPVVYVSTKE
jgi:hypothetical protein